MKNTKGKKVIKKIRSVAKKAGKEANKAAKVIQKKWKASEPERKKYQAEFEVAAKKAGKEGVRLFKAGLKNGLKIGGDVAEVVKRDIREIRNEGNK
ncbi:MAG: hypothetical protein WC764_00700 [Candidatus Paceibacterota bacterium]|jgi:hypothetical protein